MPCAGEAGVDRAVSEADLHPDGLGQYWPLPPLDGYSSHEAGMSSGEN